MSGRILAGAVAILAMAGCEGAVTFVEGDGATDAGLDSSMDTATDPMADIEADPVVDPGVDTGVDTTPDTVIDTHIDPDLDVPPDTVIDTHIDPDLDVPPDTSPDLPPDSTSCIGEGCLLVGTTLGCCPGLTAAQECSPTWPECTSSDWFCINCGDGTCDPHENRYNCWTDCGMGCGGDIAMSYSCSPIETHSCSCEPPACHPECMSTSSGEMAWVDSCSGAFIADSYCVGQHAVCDAIGSFSEGWYESGTGNLIDWASCVSEWNCSIIW